MGIKQEIKQETKEMKVPAFMKHSDAEIENKQTNKTKYMCFVGIVFAS